MTQLIIIRGNSASGKTTIAQQLQETLGDKTLLVSQDVVRREMLHVRDNEHNLSIELIQQIALYGKGKCPYVILEGILATDRYRPMLLELIRCFDGKALVYYFDLGFGETVKRHHSRPKSEEFGEHELRRWWLERDYLDQNGSLNERLITAQETQENIIKRIINDLSD